MKTKNELKKELKGFENFWKGGTSRPKMGWKLAQRRATEQNLNKIVSLCIEPFVKKTSSVLEIGAGGGFWTQKLLQAKKVTCLDALSAEHNNFWKRIPQSEKVKYYQVKDFSCSELEDKSINYVFSYDTFCHISYSGTEEYLKNLYPKLKKGSKCFIMIADQKKYKNKGGLNKLMTFAGFSNLKDFFTDYDGDYKDTPGRWYFYGVALFCDLLRKYNYDVVNEDIAGNADNLSPIIYFKKK